jgi:uncharacterized membrane protein YbhN (UPF0104 family)
MALAKIFSIQPIVNFICLLPITIAGIGTRESAMLFFYNGLAENSQILSVALLYSFIVSIVIPLACLPFTRKYLKLKK